MENGHLRLLHEIRRASPLDPIPSRDAMARHLASRRECAGDTAFAEFAYLQKVAAEIWGPEKTSHFARVLRDARVTAKQADRCPWACAEAQLRDLPDEWQPRLREQIAISRKGRAVLGRTLWSVDYTKAVLSALRYWIAFCAASGHSLRPTATSLHEFACRLVSPEGEATGVTDGTASDYLQRTMAGLLVATEGQYRSEACSFVVADWRERGNRAPSSTKTGNQLVGASTIYAFGFRLFDQARARSVRGIRAATLFRNGLILAIGAALPERARALTWLEFDRTLTLVGQNHIHVDLPGEALKYPEAQKPSQGYDVIFENPGLAAALNEYRAVYRPLFNDGLHLFPSVRGKPGSIQSCQIGQLTGTLTEKEFGVRIPIHRLRDNVATEAAENLVGGAYAAKTLLRHVDESITRRHYDRSEGLKAAGEFEDFIASQRSVTAELIL